MAKIEGRKYVWVTTERCTNLLAAVDDISGIISRHASGCEVMVKGVGWCTSRKTVDDFLQLTGGSVV